MSAPVAFVPGARALRVLRVVAALTALGTVKAAATMLGAKAEFLAAFPGVGPGWFAPLLALVALNFVAAAGTLFRLRWAVVLLLAGGLLTIVTDLLARGPAFHLWTGVGLLAVLVPAAWHARTLLR